MRRAIPLNLQRILLLATIILMVRIGIVIQHKPGFAVGSNLERTDLERTGLKSRVLQAVSPDQSALIPSSGGLVVQNRSPHPVRLVLLSRSEKKPLDSQPKDSTPAHWDFAPWEGRLKGVLVVLSERAVRLKPGDVVVAFAQDGSRQYWGPFVVGETSEPKWDQDTSEWRIVLAE
jgi:hypothetical protein